MLKEWNSAPQARSAATVCAEKPHWGKSGVPFMNSTTGLDPISDLILSTTSITPASDINLPLREHRCGSACTQLGHELPLLRRTHRGPAADFRRRSPAADT